MYEPVQGLDVFAWNHHVGVMTVNEYGIPQFQYTPEWARQSINLSPVHLPNSNRVYQFPNLMGTSFQGVPGLISDSLPDKFGNSVIDSWAQSQNINLGEFTILDRLAYIGSRGFGALEYKPTIDVFSDLQPTALDLSSVVAAARAAISGKVDDPNVLHSIMQIGASAGGMRAKIVVNYNPVTGEMEEGNRTPSPDMEPWLMKLDGVEGTELGGSQPHARIEFAYYMMAQDAGITISHSQQIRENGRTHFITKRFDRGPDNTRHHMHSVSGMLHQDYNFVGAHSYEQIFTFINDSDMDTWNRNELYRRMVFNVLAVNKDDHTKNIGFLLKEGGEWELSPAYDITFSYDPNSYWLKHHQMRINGKNDNFTLNDLQEFGDRWRIAGYNNIIDQVATAINRWESVAMIADVPANHIEYIRSTFPTLT